MREHQEILRRIREKDPTLIEVNYQPPEGKSSEKSAHTVEILEALIKNQTVRSLRISNVREATKDTTKALIRLFNTNKKLTSLHCDILLTHWDTPDIKSLVAAIKLNHTLLHFHHSMFGHSIYGVVLPGYDDKESVNKAVAENYKLREELFSAIKNSNVADIARLINRGVSIDPLPIREILYYDFYSPHWKMKPIPSWLQDSALMYALANNQPQAVALLRKYDKSAEEILTLVTTSPHTNPPLNALEVFPGEQKEREEKHAVTAEEKITLAAIHQRRGSFLAAPDLLREINIKLDNDPISKMERAYIEASPQQLAPFNHRLQQELSRILTAAIIVSSGEVQVAPDGRRHVIDIANAVTSNLWGINILCSVFFKTLAVGNEAAKKNELAKLAILFVNITEAEQLASRIARQITIAYEPIIQGTQQPPAATQGFFSTVEQLAKEFRLSVVQGESLTPIDLLAIQAGALIIKGIKEKQYGVTKGPALQSNLLCIAMQNPQYNFPGLTSAQKATLSSTHRTPSISITTQSPATFFSTNGQATGEEKGSANRARPQQPEVTARTILDLQSTLANLSREVERLGGNTAGGGQIQLAAPQPSAAADIRNEQLLHLASQLQDLTATVTLLIAKGEETRSEVDELRSRPRGNAPTPSSGSSCVIL